MDKMEHHYSINNAINKIRDMDAGESVTIDNFMDGIEAVVTKDGDYKTEERGLL